MKKADVKIGQTYQCKVGQNLTEVRIDAESPHGGWDATNVNTGRKVRIKSAQRLRWPAKQAKTETRTCYLCKKAIKKGDEQSIGQGLYRHKACDPAAKDDAKPKAKRERKPDLVDAAIQIMTEEARPMKPTEVVEIVLQKGLWTTDGKTPAATLCAAILREIQTKGDDARFRKTGRGLFELAA